MYEERGGWKNRDPKHILTYILRSLPLGRAILLCHSFSHHAQIPVPCAAIPGFNVVIDGCIQLLLLHQVVPPQASSSLTTSTGKASHASSTATMDRRGTWLRIPGMGPRETEQGDEVQTDG